jgi:FkbH-like protein
MHDILRFPFDPAQVLKKRKSIKREILGQNTPFMEKKIAILGGSTTHDIKEILELFLLDYGIRSVFFESEYGQYWQDAVFTNPELVIFHPDMIFIHTSIRNIKQFPELSDDEEKVNELLEKQFEHFSMMWEKLSRTYLCPIIQNNFEFPYFRLLGNQDASNIHGRVNYISRLNQKFYEYSQNHANFYINDINYQSADYGLSKWSNPQYWYLYKSSLCIEAIPLLSYNVANIIKSIFGKNRKAIAIDLDNTLWGGIIGDDGVKGLEIGQDTPVGQAYYDFQNYLLALKKQGIILNIISKNDHKNAIAGLNHPQMLLKPDDFICIKANWEPKSANLLDISREISLLPEAFVFVDDTIAEQDLVKQQIPGVAIPNIGKIEHSILNIDRAGYFEVTQISNDDLNRNTMYKENIARAQFQSSFSNYTEYLLYLKMKATIKPFESMYFSRLVQLINKSNQYNLTTKRYTQEDIEMIATSSKYITMYGKLEDRFGDNGLVAVAIGEINGKRLDIILWLMSCRVLKRDMEYAMMDSMVNEAKKRNVESIYGYYYPTEKNEMVNDFYEKQGFEKISEDTYGNSIWILDVTKYANRNQIIQIVAN